MQRRTGRSDDGIQRSLERSADSPEVKSIHYESLLCIEKVKTWLHLLDARPGRDNLAQHELI